MLCKWGVGGDCSTVSYGFCKVQRYHTNSLGHICYTPQSDPKNIDLIDLTSGNMIPK